jgi:hypothetical protein
MISDVFDGIASSAPPLVVFSSLLILGRQQLFMQSGPAGGFGRCPAPPSSLEGRIQLHSIVNDLIHHDELAMLFLFFDAAQLED